MKYISIVWSWLVWSSANSNKISLTLKSVIAGALTLATVYFGFGHMVPDTLIAGFVDAFIQLIQAVVGLISTVTFVYGAVRKIYLTFTGQNETL